MSLALPLVVHKEAQSCAQPSIMAALGFGFSAFTNSDLLFEATISPVFTN